MKKTVALMIAMLLCMCVALPEQAIAQEPIRSGISWYFDLKGYTMPKEIEAAMHTAYAPQTMSYADVEVTFEEILYDGYWVYASASVSPVSPETTMIMPGSAAMNDWISGGNGEKSRMDHRSFYDAAKEDGKRLLSIYVYPKEFDSLPFYFLDHRQDANDSSTLLSGSRFMESAGTITIHWSIQIYEVNRATGEYLLVDEYEVPADITPIGDVVVQTYTLCEEEKVPLESIMLIRTALTTYAIPTWANE